MLGADVNRVAVRETERESTGQLSRVMAKGFCLCHASLDVSFSPITPAAHVSCCRNPRFVVAHDVLKQPLFGRVAIGKDSASQSYAKLQHKKQQSQLTECASVSAVVDQQEVLFLSRAAL